MMLVTRLRLIALCNINKLPVLVFYKKEINQKRFERVVQTKIFKNQHCSKEIYISGNFWSGTL